MSERKQCGQQDLARIVGKSVLPPVASNCPTPARRSSPSRAIEIANADGKEEHSQLPSPSTSNPNTGETKRKRKSISSDRSCLEEKHNQDLKRQRTLQATVKQSSTESTSPIAHWVLTTFWPKDFGERGFEMADTPSSKRRSESTHRSQILVRMAVHGVFMESSNLVQKESEKLCAEYLRGSREIVKSSIFNSEEFSRVLDRVRNLNEARIQRDITPWVVPSAETLFFRGELNLPWIGEELNSEWIRCAPMGSTRPKPDYTAGLVRNAFTEDEIRRLENYITPTQPFHFTPELCFPFLICEAKTGERGLNEADRQNIHSASIAVRAIIVLYQQAFHHTSSHRIQELYGQILVFTISHDNDRVLLYGHFAVADPALPEKLRFYRYSIALFSLSTGGGADRLKAYNFVRLVYEKFAPDHLKRIKEAVAHLPLPPERTGPSFAASDLSLDQMHSQEGSQEPLSHDDDAFKMPGKPASVSLKKEMTKMKDQMEQLKQEKENREREFNAQLEQQRKDFEQQRKDFEQQRKDFEQQRKDSEQQRTELMEVLNQQSEQLKQLLARS